MMLVKAYLEEPCAEVPIELFGSDITPTAFVENLPSNDFVPTKLPLFELCQAKATENFVGEVLSIIEPFSSTTRHGIEAALLHAIKSGHVQVVKQLLPYYQPGDGESSILAEHEGRVHELASWFDGATVVEDEGELVSLLQDAGIVADANHKKQLGQPGAVLNLDTLLPTALTELDTLLVRFADGTTALFPPKALRRPGED
ncbi:hypothetical protein DIPPA_35808 [Diplonema papillatum]|nr:hypothetical protein DIPPA_35808 [Diplonema papillatum]